MSSARTYFVHRKNQFKIVENEERQVTSDGIKPLQAGISFSCCIWLSHGYSHRTYLIWFDHIPNNACTAACMRLQFHWKLQLLGSCEFHVIKWRKIERHTSCKHFNAFGLRLALVWHRRFQLLLLFSALILLFA